MNRLEVLRLILILTPQHRQNVEFRVLPKTKQITNRQGQRVLVFVGKKRVSLAKVFF